MRALFLALFFVFGFSAMAQDYGLTAGFSETAASSKLTGFSSSADFGFRLGGVMSIPLEDHLNFRSGLIFTQRHFDLSQDGSSNKGTLSFDYIDIPAMAQFNFTDNVGVFGGLIVAVNVDHSGPTGVLPDVTGTKPLYPLIQLGINGTFQNMFGIEAYYEMGLGDICDQAKNFSVFGANFIYWL